MGSIVRTIFFLVRRDFHSKDNQRLSDILPSSCHDIGKVVNFDMLCPILYTLYDLKLRCYSHSDWNITFNITLECEQMGILLYCFFNPWPFTELKICPVTLKFCQSRFKILPNTKCTISIFIFCQIGKISRNLVTPTQLTNLKNLNQHCCSRFSCTPHGDLV